jgi:hypothetical protein
MTNKDLTLLFVTFVQSNAMASNLNQIVRSFVIVCVCRPDWRKRMPQSPGSRAGEQDVAELTIRPKPLPHQSSFTVSR